MILSVVEHVRITEFVGGSPVHPSAGLQSGALKVNPKFKEVTARQERTNWNP